MRVPIPLATLVVLIALVNSPGFGEQRNTDQKLAITNIDSVKEVEPAIFEVVVALQDGSKATLRMNAFTLMALGNQINLIGR